MSEDNERGLKIQKRRAVSAQVFSAIIALFGWYMVLTGAQGSYFLVLACIFTAGAIIPFLVNGKATEFVLDKDEKIIKDYQGVKWSGTSILSWRTSPSKNVALTNKRIVLSANFFGTETYKGALSVFYNKDEYEKHSGFTSCLLKDVYIKKDAVCVVGKSKTQYVDFTWKFTEDKDFIFETIQKYRKNF